MKNLQTTIAGAVLILGSVGVVVFEALSPNAVPQEHIALVLAAMVTGSGLIAAKDAKGGGQ